VKGTCIGATNFSNRQKGHRIMEKSKTPKVQDVGKTIRER